jgi:integrase/recombinase XerD
MQNCLTVIDYFLSIFPQKFKMGKSMEGLITHANDFLIHCKIAKNLSDKTITAYQTDLLQFSAHIAATYGLSNAENVDKNMIRSHLTLLSGALKPKSVKRKVATLKAFFNYLELEDIIAINPVRKLRIKIKEPFVLPTYLTLTEVSTILQTADQARKDANKTACTKVHRIALRNLAILEMLFATGIRVSELCSLRREDVDLARGVIRVVGKGNKERMIHLGHEATLKHLTRYERAFHESIERAGYFFINTQQRPVSSQTVRKIVKAIAHDSHVQRRITPHTFRHTFATLLMEEGVDIKYIQQFLGHSSIMTTQIYTHVSRKKQEEILLKQHPRGRI